MASLLGYMDIHDVVISCGTCHEMLDDYQVHNIFPDSSIIDINEFISREGLYAAKGPGGEILYHKPCHSPLKKEGESGVFNKILGATPKIIANCCGEGGTLALSTPGISTVLRTRKRDNILEKSGGEKYVTVISTCPSCIQGLSRIQGVNARSLAVHVAEQFLGPRWRKDFIKNVKTAGGIESIIY
jgi:Fe-S oxidoreductase